jgi:hypothetical protein
VVWHDNVSNAERPEDLLSVWQLNAELETGRGWLVEGGHRLRAGLRMRTEIWPRFEGLNQVASGIALAWEYKTGVGPHRPVFATEAVGIGVAAQERNRSGRGDFGRLEWTASPNWVFAVEACGREGDVVSCLRPPRPNLGTIGKQITLLDTFEQWGP